MLALTAYEDDEALYAAIMAGAAGYVLKRIRVGAIGLLRATSPRRTL